MKSKWQDGIVRYCACIIIIKNVVFASWYVVAKQCDDIIISDRDKSLQDARCTCLPSLVAQLPIRQQLADKQAEDRWFIPFLFFTPKKTCHCSFPGTLTPGFFFSVVIYWDTLKTWYKISNLILILIHQRLYFPPQMQHKSYITTLLIVFK